MLLNQIIPLEVKMNELRKKELKYKLGEISTDIQQLIELCYNESLQVPDWVTSRIASLKMNFNYVKNEINQEMLNEH